MKKMMLLVAGLVCAASVQAATFNWGSAWVYSTDYDNGTAAGSAWLVMLGAGGTAAISVDGGVLTLGANTLMSGPADVASGGADTAGLSLAAATYNGQNFVMVGYDSGNGYWGISDVWTVAGLTDVPAPNLITHYFGTGGEELLLNNVPEPTSMALLALGAAALGLRRKFRK